MIKILILAYEFPPYISVGGLRAFSWYKYMSAYGIKPVVITRQWSNQYGRTLDYVAPGESDNTITEESDDGILVKSPYYPNIANRILLKYGENRFVWPRRIISAVYEFLQFIFRLAQK